MMIREERASDYAAREDLLDAAFGVGRHEKTCERLREGREPAQGLSFIAETDGDLIGTVRLWNVKAGACDALLLGPLAVSKIHRSKGLGAMMMRTALNRAATLGHKAVILVGDASYYERFGFSVSLVAGLALPGPVDRTRFLGLELIDGALFGASGFIVAAEPAELQLKRDLPLDLQPLKQAA